jgi:hypothetical protein
MTMTDEELREAYEEECAIQMRRNQTLLQAKRLADEAAEEARRKGASAEEVESEWLCWFEEELDRAKFMLIGEEVPEWWYREQAIWEEVNGL